MSGRVHFYDASVPANVPSGSFAAVYTNEGNQWSRSDVRRMGYIFGVSVNTNLSAARWARCIDVEPGISTNEFAVRFIKARRSHGHSDSTIYTTRSNWIDAYKACAAAGEFPRWWIATLDGSTTIEAKYYPPGAFAWAVQYQGGTNAPYDKSLLFGTNDFHRPY